MNVFNILHILPIYTCSATEISIAVVPKCQWRANTSSLAIGFVSLAKFQDFTSYVEEKKVFDWAQDDQSLNIWLKTDVFSNCCDVPFLRKNFTLARLTQDLGGSRI